MQEGSRHMKSTRQMASALQGCSGSNYPQRTRPPRVAQGLAAPGTGSQLQQGTCCPLVHGTSPRKGGHRQSACPWLYRKAGDRQGTVPSRSGYIPSPPEHQYSSQTRSRFVLEYLPVSSVLHMRSSINV